MGVSALPVLARILAERRMLQNQLGVVTMAATAIGILYLPLALSPFFSCLLLSFFSPLLHLLDSLVSSLLIRRDFSFLLSND